MAGPKKIPKSIQQTIDEALTEMEKAIGMALIDSATAAAISGDATAQQAIAGKISWKLVDKAALALMKNYAAEIARGGSTIDGKFVPWLSDSTTATREKLVTLIEEAINSGIGLGVKEGPNGYPKNTLADQLKDLFAERKSHASTVARTEVSRIRNDAAFGRYVSAGVERVEVTGPDDDLTCDECGLVVGEVFDINEAPYIPVHPNCRHGLAPKIEIPGKGET